MYSVRIVKAEFNGAQFVPGFIFENDFEKLKQYLKEDFLIEILDEESGGMLSPVFIKPTIIFWEKISI